MIDLLLACAPSVDPAIMGAIVQHESGGYPWVINDNSGKKSYRLNSKAEAILTATQLISAGHSIDMGLAQINSKNLGWLGLSIADAFDPCSNLAAGARILNAGLQETGSLASALSMYNSGRPDSRRGMQYASQVLWRAGYTIKQTPTVAAAAPLAASPSPAASGFSPEWR